MTTATMVFLWTIAFFLMCYIRNTLTQSIPPMPSTCTANIRDRPSRFSCNTCKDRCNNIQAPFLGVHCSCDPACVAYGDCCVDFETKCPEEFNKSEPLRKQFKFQGTDCLAVPTLPPTYVRQRGYLRRDKVAADKTERLFISVCGLTGKVCERIEPRRLVPLNLTVPVTDVTSGLNYVNYECARCNSAKNITLWSPELICDKNVPIVDNINQTWEIGSVEQLTRYTDCSPQFVIPKNFIMRILCTTVIDKCPQRCDNQELIRKCEQSAVNNYIEKRGKRYKNYYCALCWFENDDAFRCAQFRKNFQKPTGTPGVAVFSLSLLFDIDPSNGPTVGRRPCPRGTRRVANSAECSLIVCPPDQRLLKNTCIPLKLNSSLSASLSFNQPEELDAALAFLQEDSSLLDGLTRRLQTLLPIGDDVTITVTVVKISDLIMNVTFEFFLYFDRNSTFSIESEFANFSQNAVSEVENQLVLALQSAGINLGRVTININQLVFTQQFLPDCTWLHFPTTDFELGNNDTLFLPSTQLSYTRETYYLTAEGDALVCVHEADITAIRVRVSEVLGILTIILTVLSILCLAVRLILQFKLSYYSTFAARLHFNLAFALCLAYITFLVGGGIAISGDKHACAIVAVFTYWFFLVVFVSMTVLTIDMWLVFRPSSRFVVTGNTSNKTSTLAAYVIPCWIIPGIMAVIVALFDHTGGINAKFKPRFGHNICWFNQSYAQLVYFGAPVALCTILSIIFFILTVFALRTTKHSSGMARLKTKEQKRENLFWVYFRLFVLMGGTWLFAFVAAFVGHDALWIIFIILNASQGILLFISLVLTRKVLREICSKRAPTSQSSQTTSTALSSSKPTYNPILKEAATKTSAL